MESPTGSADKVLVLRTCKSDMSSYGRFAWPREGYVEALDWDPTPECGAGLHGLAWGEGNGSLLNWSKDAVWLVVEVVQADVVDLDGKVKFRAGNVIFAGTREEAVGRIAAHPQAQGRAVVVGTATAGDFGTANAGYRGTATAGHFGTATAGHFGTATAGDHGTATAGYDGTATAGYCGTVTVGDYGTATAGDDGTATAGYRGTATAGDYGTATAGDDGTATAGYRGTATAGHDGTAAAGDRGVISIRGLRPDGTLMVCSAAVGGDIRPNVPYRLDRDGQLREKQP